MTEMSPIIQLLAVVTLLNVVTLIGFVVLGRRLRKAIEALESLK